jgi:trigger factor
VKSVKIAAETKLDDDFAKTLGLKDLDQLKGLIRDQQAQELNGLTRTHMKRQLLDQLAARHDFEVPVSMVESEYQNIINQLRHEASHEADPQAALAEIEKDSADYRRIAERRVRLGLLLSEIGGANGVEVTEQEMNRLIGQAASQYQGKDALFAVTVKAVKTAGETKLDDEFAKSLGLNDLKQLKGLIRGQLEQELNGLTRTHMKRQLLDQLASRHDFAVPDSMVEAEFQNIMNQLRHEASHEADPQAALAELNEESGDYRRIAERRVRLGLLLSEIGAANGVEVSEQEMRALIGQAASQYQGKERERFLQLVQQEPMFAAQLRAPLYEDKVVDFLFGKADITDRKATREQLEADLESEEGHVHGPGCGHDHGEVSEKPKAKKAQAAKVSEAAAEVAPVKASKSASKKAKAEAKVEAKEPIPTKSKPAKKADLVAEAPAPKPSKPVKSEPANKKAAEKAASKPAKSEAKPAAKPKKAAKKG